MGRLADFRERHDRLALRQIPEVMNLLARPSRKAPLVFLPPPLPNASGIEALTDCLAIGAEGVQMKNCLISYIGDLLGEAERANGDPSGCSQYFYRVLEPERATLQIMRGADGWAIAELRGKANTEVSKETRKAIQAWLDECNRGRS
jgi:hypothetical protein